MRLLLKSQQKLHNSTYSHLQSLCDNGDKLGLFSKIILAKILVQQILSILTIY